jgi:hypothetical protein
MSGRRFAFDGLFDEAVIKGGLSQQQIDVVAWL